MSYTYFVYISNDHFNFIYSIDFICKSFLKYIANFIAGHEILNKFLKKSFVFFF